MTDNYQAKPVAGEAVAGAIDARGQQTFEQWAEERGRLNIRDRWADGSYVSTIATLALEAWNAALASRDESPASPDAGAGAVAGVVDAAGDAFQDMFHKCRAEVSMDWWQRIWGMAVRWAWEHPQAGATPTLRSALNAMLTQFGMDEDDWNKPTFDQARKALAAPASAPEAHHRIPGLGFITDEDEGRVTLQFKDEAAASQFMKEYGPSVDIDDMPPRAPEAPEQQGEAAECERCGLSPKEHAPGHWCDNQSFVVPTSRPHDEALMKLSQFAHTAAHMSENDMRNNLSSIADQLIVLAQAEPATGKVGAVPTVEQVERELWISHFEWHEANPSDIIAAVLRLATPAPTVQAETGEMSVAMKHWASYWFGPDADEAWIAQALANLPRTTTEKEH